MQAICRTQNFTAQLREVPTPEAVAGHLLVQVHACAINPGDVVWLSGGFPPGSVPESLHDIAGVSGAGQVIALGEGVPASYAGKNVAFYRSLVFSDHLVGAWAEYACLPWLDCVILPDGANPQDYSGSLVNVITPYAFWQQSLTEGAQGILCTAGTAATGRAMIGICQAKGMPCIALARKAGDVAALEALGATRALSLDQPDFAPRLASIAAGIGRLAVFDGVGGETLSRVAPALSYGSSIYSYGFLGNDKPFCIQTSDILGKGLRIAGFANFLSATVQNQDLLAQALDDLAGLMTLPHFKTPGGRCFRFDEIEDALACAGHAREKPILLPH